MDAGFVSLNPFEFRDAFIEDPKSPRSCLQCCNMVKAGGTRMSLAANYQMIPCHNPYISKVSIFKCATIYPKSSRISHVCMYADCGCKGRLNAHWLMDRPHCTQSSTIHPTCLKQKVWLSIMFELVFFRMDIDTCLYKSFCQVVHWKIKVIFRKIFPFWENK